VKDTFLTCLCYSPLLILKLLFVDIHIIILITVLILCSLIYLILNGILDKTWRFDWRKMSNCTKKL